MIKDDSFKKFSNKNDKIIDSDPLFDEISNFQENILPKMNFIESFHTESSLEEALSLSYRLFQKNSNSKVNH